MIVGVISLRLILCSDFLSFHQYRQVPIGTYSVAEADKFLAARRDDFATTPSGEPLWDYFIYVQARTVLEFPISQNGSQMLQFRGFIITHYGF